MRNLGIDSLELNLVKEQFLKYCSFSMGKQKIRQMQPSNDRLWVERELLRVKESYSLVIRYGNLPFQGIHDIRMQLDDASKDMTLTAIDLRKVSDCIRGVEHIEKYFSASEIETPTLKDLIDSFSDQRFIATKIDACISMNGDVMDRASSELAAIRRSISQCMSDISSEVTRFISRNSAKLMDTVTTIRNGRTCVMVKISEKNTVDGLVHGESASGQTAYVEPRSFVILNNRLQSLKSKEAMEIERILFELSQVVKGCVFELSGNLETFAILDSLFARAFWTKENDGCVAEIKRAAHVYFKNARHPLIDSNHVVANTYEVKKPFHSILITGSNTGGKTVTLKTIGLFVIMSLCGMPIACEEAKMPIFDSVFVDIGDAQSISESLSTFSSHISKLAHICEHVSEKSLVLLDELGSGTDPKEGEPLALAILDDLRRSNAMIIATTHYSALKNYATQHEDVLLSSVEFDVEKMQPTYRYIEGISGQSNAFEIARRYGLKDSIIAVAQQQKEANLTEQDKMIQKLETTRVEVYELKEKLNQRYNDIKLLQKELQDEKIALEKAKAKAVEDAVFVAQLELAKKQEEADKIIEELKQLQENAKPHEVISLKTKLAKLQEEEQAKIGESESFEVGDYVLLKEYQYYGDVIAIKKDKITVLANGMKFNVVASDLTHATKQKQNKPKKSYASHGIKHMSMECNVIGMRVNEAIDVIDKYLDNAILAKVYNVRLIHGMGTGALRKGVHDYLKRNPRVDSYRMGGQGEGGLGATVVTLKQKGK